MPPAGTSRVKKGRRSFSDIALIALFIFGLSVFLYPPLANFYNHQRQKAAVVSYEEAVSKLDTTQVERLLDEAEAYNDVAHAIRQLSVTHSDHKNVTRLQLVQIREEFA